MPYAATWMDLEIILSDEKDMISLMWNLKNDTKELIYQ